MTPKKPDISRNRRLSVAPMMDWTDRHCRFFHRVLSRHTLLYTEMVTAPALVFGDADRLLEFNAAEHPVALQLGGSDPDQLAQATRMGCNAGYDEININIGCPSDRVQSGRFGACLMEEPDLVADCVSAMIEASTGAEITVKCRIGVDDQDPETILPQFIETVAQRGVKSFAIHARKAWLQGLSPKENRDVPPLDYDLVHRIKSERPDLEIVLNGGLQTLGAALEHMNRGLDGAMIGRVAYHEPMAILGQADRLVFGDDTAVTPAEAVRAMLPYAEAQLAKGIRLHQISRHMLGLFAGQPGARKWKRVLSENAHKTGAGPELLERALAEVVEVQSATVL